MIRLFTRQIERLHAEDGQALVFVALVGLVIFLFFAMTMNVADLVNTKIKNQNVADATALSAAVWEARTLNLVAASNRNMLELWAGALALGDTCLVVGGGCAAIVCGELSIDPLPCILCLAFAGGVCGGAASVFAAAVLNGQFEDVILDTVDRNVVDPDLSDVVNLSYAFKPNTASDDVGVYVRYPSSGDDLLQAYVPGLPDSSDYVLERAGICDTLVMVARYFNYLWHFAGEPPSGLTDADWNSFLPTIYDWYSPPEGACYQKPSVVPPGFEAMFPLALRSRATDWSPQNVDSLLAVTVATYKAQEPPPVLGKGSGPGDCTWEEGDTRFACPNTRNYAFASAHAYSESASDFYNTQMAGLATSHLALYVPFEMDWEARLFPVDGQAYRDIADLIGADGFAGDRDTLLANLLRLNDMDFFLY